MVFIEPGITIQGEGTRVRVAVAVPTYNEAGNLPTLAERLMALPIEVHLVVVDDASPDGTGRLADEIAAREPRVHVIHRSGPRGYSAASKEGLAWCLGEGYELVGTMDADLSHDPDVLPKLVAAVDAGADVAIGSRYTPGGELVVDWGPVRRAVSQAGSAYARLMIGTKTRDCTSGFRCYRASMLSRVPFERIESEGYSFLIELAAYLRDLGAVTVEVPITYVDRVHGSSKISGHIVREAFIRTTAVGLARLTGARRRAAANAS
jgi:dolichol-phosphate mannosyltransferase